MIFLDGFNESMSILMLGSMCGACEAPPSQCFLFCLRLGEYSSARTRKAHQNAEPPRRLQIPRLCCALEQYLLRNQTSAKPRASSARPPNVHAQHHLKHQPLPIAPTSALYLSVQSSLVTRFPIHCGRDAKSPASCQPYQNTNRTSKTIYFETRAESIGH